MSERGKLYFVKLSVHTFDDEKIKLMLAMPDGDTLVVLWFQLLTQAAKCNAGGLIILSDTIPCNPEMLSKLWGRSETQVRYAMKTFSELGMVTDQNGASLVSNFMRHHPEIAERERERTKKQLQRARKALPSAAQGSGCSSALAAKWDHVFDALRDTGKLPTLTLEHLALVNHEYPRADLAKNFPEIVLEAKGVTGVVSTVLPWLRKTVGRLELRKVSGSTSAQNEGGPRTPYVMLEARPDNE